MRLEPSHYCCPIDGQDLTELVTEELEVVVPAAFGRPRAKKFEVIVTCPGQQKAHDVSFSGVMSR